MNIYIHICSIIHMGRFYVHRKSVSFFLILNPAMTFFCEHYDRYDHLVLVKTSLLFIRSILINAIIRHLNKG